MTHLDCSAARRLLDEYYDGELSIEQQIQVDAHLELCTECFQQLEELRLLHAALRASTDPVLTNDEAATFATTVVSRWKAERQASLVSDVASMFDDLHLVYAGFGAAVATAVCVAGIFGLTRFATLGRPDVLSFLSMMSGTSAGIPVDDEMETRWTARYRQANAAAEQDAVFALQEVVTKQDPTAPTGRRASSTEDAKRLESLLDGLARARFRQAVEQPPTALSMMWVVARTTVRPRVES